MLINAVILFPFCLTGGAAALAYLGAQDDGCPLTRKTLYIATGWMLAFLLAGTLCLMAGYPAPLDVLMLCLLSVACSITDGLRCWLPHAFTLPVLATGLIWQLAKADSLWWLPVTGIVCATAPFLLLRIGHYLCGMRGEHLYPGSGDIVLMATFGVWLGPAAAFLIQFAGLLLFMVWLLTTRRTVGPLGPFLCLSAITSMLVHAVYPFF
ncbi:prepilin peptidase [Citrobacter amalonaticus]|nr:prepilin peptidase [Citrobacter amalonaticus]